MITLPIHTLVTLVGPSGCGKSTRVKDFVEQLKPKYPDYNFPVVSSDDIRRMLLGRDAHKYEDEMMYASESAFKILFELLKGYMAFPQSLKNLVVFVDTTGLSEPFRKGLNKLADQYCYNKAAIVFNFKNREDYYLFNNPDKDTRTVISQGIDRLRLKVLPVIRREAELFTITSKQQEVEIQLDPGQYQQYKYSQLSDSKDYCVIGDVHGCIEELKTLLQKSGFELEGNVIKPSNKIAILNGDWCDKNSEENILKMIDFIYENLGNGILAVLGNHEDWVYRYLRGQIKADHLTYFWTAGYLLKPENKEYRRKFYQIVERSPFFYIHKNFICTHSPCQVRHLAKLNTDSIRAQVKFRYPHIKDFNSEEDYIRELEKALWFVTEESVSNYPFQISGHIPISKPIKVGSRLMIDTGATERGSLTSVEVRGRKFTFTSIKTGDATLPELFKKTNNVSYSSLNPKEVARVERSLKSNPINFISGTMAPAPAWDEDLESVKGALSYYQSVGVNHLVMQPKGMGSRCQLYWKPQKEECYAVSRNGFVIRHVDLSAIWDTWHPKLERMFPDAELVIVDGELLPWSLLGHNLIEHHFAPIKQALNLESRFLKENSFQDLYDELLNSAAEYKQDAVKSSKSSLREKYGHKADWFRAALNTQYLPHLYWKEKFSEAFSKQLHLYGQATAPQFWPFQVLKVAYSDSELVLPFDNEMGFSLLNESPLHLIDLTNSKAAYGEAHKHYVEWVCNAEKYFGFAALEGVVIKPVDPATKAAPYLKVRNPEYLRIVYGADYTSAVKYKKLITTKKIFRKVKASIAEWELGISMLNIPYSSISPENQQMRQYLVNFIGEEKELEVIDPRL